MAPRAHWKGYMKLSLVSCSVALFPASSSQEKISFHLLNRETGHRLKQQYVDAETGDIVERDDRAKGYEVGKNDYVMLDEDELADLDLESNHTIDIESFVPRQEVDAVYLDSPYYIVPDGKVGEEAFAVVREAMDKRNVVGIARVVLHARERLLMLEPRGKGIVGTTLRYDYEVRGADEYFDHIPKASISGEMLDLASHIIDTKEGSFDPSKFEDRYQKSVVALIRAKRAGKPIPTRAAEAPSNVINLMDALRRSLGKDESEKSNGKAAARPARAKARTSRKASSPRRAPAKRRARKAG